MKFKDISERVKGGKLDPLSKMGRSKLTGQEIATYYRQNPKAKQAAKDPMVKKAIELALDLGGNQTLAMKEIEKMKRGLSKNPAVASALRTANEDMTSTSSVAMPEIPLGKVRKRKDLEESLKPHEEKISKVFKTKNPVEIKGIDKLIDMSSIGVVQSMQKQNPRGFKKTVMSLGKLNESIEESTELNEASVTYRIRKAQKPEIDNMMKGARMMKLKVTGNRVKTVGADPKRKTGDTEITVSGTAKNLRDFDAVVRGKSSYGDPSLIKEESATMKKVRQVVKKKGMMNIDGMKLDLTTASMIASVYDKVNPMNKKRMDKLKLPQLVNLTMKVAGKGKMKKEDAVERAKELADLKAKHKREVEQEKDEIAATKQTNESLWRNIHNKRKSGKKMRKPGEKGAPTAQDFKNARGEAVSPAQQAAIAISKKERGEKPKNECADEKDFKPHKMYKGDKEVMANTYADHVKYDKMGYTHEKPKKEALDAKDKPFVKDLVKKLRGGSKTHAKQADDLEKALNTESMSRAKADAMRDMGKRKDRDDDGNPVATADDRKAADKNVVMQIRKVTDLQRPTQIELRNGKKVMLKPADAKMMMKKFDAIRKPQDRLKVQNAMNDKKMTVQGLKRLLGK